MRRSRFPLVSLLFVDHTRKLAYAELPSWITHQGWQCFKATLLGLMSVPILQVAYFYDPACYCDPENTGHSASSVYYGYRHPMKPHRITMTHSLLLHSPFWPSLNVRSFCSVSMSLTAQRTNHFAWVFHLQVQMRCYRLSRLGLSGNKLLRNSVQMTTSDFYQSHVMLLAGIAWTKLWKKALVQPQRMRSWSNVALWYELDPALTGCGI